MTAQWISQNKRIPGAYFNFVGVAKPSMAVGDRGIGTLAMPLSWGPEGELIDVLSEELLDGRSLSKVGFTAFDAEPSNPLRLMLSNCYMAKVYRLDRGGARATGAQGNLTVRAKYPGTKGNRITIQVTSVDGVFDVTTYVDDVSKDTQRALTVQELKNNDYVEFSGSGNLVVNAGIVLAGGTNGTVSAATAYPAYLALARKASWQAMALTQDNTAFAPQFAKFAQEMWDVERKYVQVVVANYDGADYHTVINSDCGVMIGDVEATAETATAWVAGIEAGAAVNQSAGAKIFTGATRILNTRTKPEIDEALAKGMFILMTNTDGSITPADDINSLHTFTDDLTEDFKFNQVIRVIGEVGERASEIWEKKYKHIVQNNVTGRNLYKGELLSSFGELQRMGAIENFSGSDDITVEEGAKKSSVVLTINKLDVVVAMSTLYGLVYVV